MREMKDSGIQWIGDIPSDWNAIKAKRVFSLVTKQSDSPKKIALENIESHTGRFISTTSTFDGDGIEVEVGDLVYGKLRPYLSKAWLAEFECNAVGDFCVFRCNSDVNVEFIHKIFLSPPFSSVITASTYGAKMPRVSPDFILSLTLPLPSIKEQVVISKFIDGKSGVIDDLIAVEKEMIAELQAYKQSVIVEAVTKGLNSNALMKDSDIPWIGQIPAHWEIKRLGTLYTQRNEKVSDKDFPPLSVTMKGILPQLETAAKTNDGDNRKLVCKGDFAINSRSDRRGACGVSPFDGSVSLINTVLVPNENMCTSYYNWLFHTPIFSDEFYRWGHGIVDDLWTTRWSEMKNIYVPCTDIREQEIIAGYLDKKCGEIDSLMKLKLDKIVELKEYKKSLIYEYVTGKKEVPEQES